MTLTIKRVYAEPSPSDGFRVLVDRLWPRGMTHERADLDEWLKEIAPSPALRKWWGHNPATMDDFAHKYEAELDDNPAVAQLEQIIASHPVVTLVYAAKDPAVNHALILRNYMEHDLDQLNSR